VASEGGASNWMASTLVCRVNRQNFSRIFNIAALINLGISIGALLKAIIISPWFNSPYVLIS
jgi:hypothetical protein